MFCENAWGFSEKSQSIIVIEQTEKKLMLEKKWEELYPLPLSLPVHVELKNFIINFWYNGTIKNHFPIYIAKGNTFSAPYSFSQFVVKAGGSVRVYFAVVKPMRTG